MRSIRFLELDRDQIKSRRHCIDRNGCNPTLAFLGNLTPPHVSRSNMLGHNHNRINTNARMCRITIFAIQSITRNRNIMIACDIFQMPRIDIRLYQQSACAAHVHDIHNQSGQRQRSGRMIPGTKSVIMFFNQWRASIFIRSFSY